MSHDLSGYEEVPARIRQFFEKYPDGSLRCEKVEYRDLPVVTKGGELTEQLHVIYHALAYRTPSDIRPGQGKASEPIPGLTPYTKGSELMNAETSAWGRALVALGFVAQKIASAEEVRNRQDGEAAGKPEKRQIKDPDAPASDAQRKFLGTLLKRAQIKTVEDANRVLSIFTGREITGGTGELTKGEASDIVERLKNGEVPSVKFPTDAPADASEFEAPKAEGDVPWTDEQAVEAIKAGFNATEEPAA